jgi:hypothetical protein
MPSVKCVYRECMPAGLRRRYSPSGKGGTSNADLFGLRRPRADDREILPFLRFAA